MAERNREYWQLWARCAIYPVGCASAQERGVCRGDCRVRSLTGIRSPINLLGVDREFVSERIERERPLTLAEARCEQAEAFVAAIRKHLLRNLGSHIALGSTKP